jgi:peptidoglycan hydrolase-like protein with peptidoglycan-binding domain
MSSQQIYTDGSISQRSSNVTLRTLRRGDRGDDVKMLQGLLQQRGYDVGPLDGQFGPKTEAALKAFQRANGLTADGIFGPRTAPKLGVLHGTTSSPMGARAPSASASTGNVSVGTLKRGSRGDDVKMLQGLLQQRGYSVGPIDGIFGSKTEAALKAFQRDNGLTADGILGAKTAPKLGLNFSGPGATTGTGGTGGGGRATAPAPATSKTPKGSAADKVRQIPGGGELWKVGNTFYLAYTVPGTKIPLVWKVENKERLSILFPDGAKPDRTMTVAQFRARSPWLAGLSAEIATQDEDPWQVFLSQHEQHLHRKPWLRDPTVIAVMAVAYLEGRTPTADELAETDWWKNHTAEERNLMVSMSDAGRAQAKELVKDLHEMWLGSTFGKVSDKRLDQWVDRFYKNTNAAGSLLEGLKAQRRALFPDFDENLTWDQIVTPTRNLAENVWGQPFDDDKFLVDLVNTRDYNKASQRLRQEGLHRNVDKVVSDALTGLQRTALGDQVVRSAV